MNRLFFTVKLGAISTVLFFCLSEMKTVESLTSEVLRISSSENVSKECLSKYFFIQKRTHSNLALHLVLSFRKSFDSESKLKFFRVLLRNTKKLEAHESFSML